MYSIHRSYVAYQNMQCYDWSNANVLSAMIIISSMALTVFAMVNDAWTVIVYPQKRSPAPLYGNSTVQFLEEHDGNVVNVNKVLTFIRAQLCERVGARHFWSAGQFGNFVDEDGESHVAYHWNDQVILDCVTPLTQNLYFAILALCFVHLMMCVSTSVFLVLVPPTEFLRSIRRHTVPEILTLMTLLVAVTVAMVAHYVISTTRHHARSIVIYGPGLYLMAFATLGIFGAALISRRRSNALAREIREQNQRMLCARSLRSWRDVGRRYEDTRPIIDFERYLDLNSANVPAPAVADPTTALNDSVRASPLDEGGGVEVYHACAPRTRATIIVRPVSL